MKLRPWSTRMARSGRGDWPVATLIFYGPDDRRATRMVASIITYDGAEPLLRTWFADRVDARVDNAIGNEVGAFLRRHAPPRIVVMNSIFGCPHEEGIDYPDGEVCPRCPFWATHDRFENVTAVEYRPKPRG
ncbi:hypothetical protein [Longimicrobium sp.]|uniref:hypothetical protein n=1 Tax=Longimicrobium sp. TaxID=2029185 RepID=UPI002E3294F0|nr:hypothetical protein [Longimicrobium sp.]HEX6040566.1 hypothetical protein [Longimicrobium sp.]